jgi:hypothetical protein
MHTPPLKAVSTGFVGAVVVILAQQWKSFELILAHSL